MSNNSPDNASGVPYTVDQPDALHDSISDLSEFTGESVYSHTSSPSTSLPPPSVFDETPTYLDSDGSITSDMGPPSWLHAGARWHQTPADNLQGGALPYTLYHTNQWDSSAGYKASSYWEPSEENCSNADMAERLYWQGAGRKCVDFESGTCAGKISFRRRSGQTNNTFGWMA